MLSRRWEQSTAPEEAATIFLEALKQGDREAAWRLLTPRQLKVAKARAGLFSEPWTATPGLSYSIVDIQIDGDDAKARTLIELDGWKMKPVLSLQRSSTGRWKIDGINNVDVDPLWKAASNELLQRELSEALKDLPGATVAETPNRERALR